jgi:RNA polymerase sigma factor FliA
MSGALLLSIPLADQVDRNLLQPSGSLIMFDDSEIMKTTSRPAGRPTADAAEALWRAWAEHHDMKARNRLVLAYAPMVKYLACRRARRLPPHYDLDDLVSCGLLALITAIDRFDPQKGAAFEQYAWTRVCGALVDELRHQDWAPRSLRRDGRAIDRARDELQASNGHPPSNEQLAEALQIDVPTLKQRLEMLIQAELLSLNAPARGHDEVFHVEVGDTIEAAPGTHDPELTAIANDRASVIHDAIASLPEREQRILHLRLQGHMDGAQIGQALGITESRISQLLAQARATIKHHIDHYDQAAPRRAA